jgi:hypothetical protein
LASGAYNYSVNFLEKEAIINAADGDARAIAAKSKWS